MEHYAGRAGRRIGTPGDRHDEHNEDADVLHLVDDEVQDCFSALSLHGKTVRLSPVSCEEFQI